jgi:hypothetical protein
MSRLLNLAAEINVLSKGRYMDSITHDFRIIKI